MLAGPTNPAERKALLIALIPCLLFIAFLTVLRGSVRRTERRFPNPRPYPTATPKRVYVEEPVVADLHEFPIPPKVFKGTNFGTRSYGPYKLSNGKSINLTLEGGEHRIVGAGYAGWFSLKDVYYADVTGDGQDEAIVMLSHVSCDARGSCDGGTHLFYIYAVRNGKLRTLWQYETGSNAYGCGLRGLTVDGKQFVLELFGRCPKDGTNDPNADRYIAEDLTFQLFEFDGRRFVRQSVEVVSSPAQNVMNYKPNIRIYNSPQTDAKSTKDLMRAASQIY